MKLCWNWCEASRQRKSFQFFALLGNTAPMLTGIKHAFLRKQKDICAVGLADDGVIADIDFQSILKWTNSNLGFSE
jgi:pyruvate/2-oxoacid:ferredoxin oxidoreductase beta subunit